jgi:hypothetical protein
MLPAAPVVLTAVAVSCASLSASALADASTSGPLSFSTYASVSGTLIHYAADTGFPDAQLAGPADVQTWAAYQGGTPNPIASSNWSLGGGGDPGSHDPTYNLLTVDDLYNFTFAGQAQVLGTQLKAQISTAYTDVSNSMVRSSMSAWSSASITDHWLITSPAASGPGSFGRIRITFSLDGKLSGNAFSQMTVQSNFLDWQNLQHVSGQTITASSGDGPYSQIGTALLLFEYGVPFTFSAQLNAFSADNGNSDFFNTAKLTNIEMPIGTTLITGALQSAIEPAPYGTVWNSTAADLIVSSVPEPETYAMLLAGLAILGTMVRWRRPSSSIRGA